MIVIDLQKKPHKAGSYGMYFNLEDGRGVKVLKKFHQTPESVLGSADFGSAKIEADALIKFAESNVTVKCFGVEVVQIIDGGRIIFAPGIIMEHLGEVTLEHAVGSGALARDKSSVHQENLKLALRSAGIDHRDLHGQNIMFHQGRCYAIDFTPNHFNEIKKKE